MRWMGQRPPLPEDVLLVGGQVPGSDAYRVLRARQERLEVGELRQLKEGKPIDGDVVKLKPRPEHERLFEVETLASSEELRQAAGHSGPPQVATDQYRENWSRVFGSERPN